MTIYIYDSMEYSPPSEANSFSPSQEIPRILWNPKGSLPHSQEPVTCPYPEPYQSNPYLPIPSTSILSLHLRLGLLSCFFPSDLPTKTLCAPLLSPIPATRPGHLILFDLIIRLILVELCSRERVRTLAKQYFQGPQQGRTG